MAREGVSIAGIARKSLEDKTGKKVISADKHRLKSGRK